MRWRTGRQMQELPALWAGSQTSSDVEAAVAAAVEAAAVIEAGVGAIVGVLHTACVSSPES